MQSKLLIFYTYIPQPHLIFVEHASNTLSKRETVIKKTRETLELANKHAQETIPVPEVLPVESGLSVQPNAAEDHPESTAERGKRWLRAQAKILMFLAILSFFCVAVFGCISAAISTLPVVCRSQVGYAAAR